MINLLPPEAKAEIRAGRVNRLLVRYLILFTCLMFLLFVAIGATLYALNDTKANAKASVDQAMSDSANIKDEQKKVTEFQKNLSTARQILDSQISYSTVITRIASSIPKDVIIESLTIDSSSLTQPTTITAHAKNNNAVLALKDALSKSTYFKSPHFTTITTADSGDYPITITMNVAFTTELFK